MQSDSAKAHATRKLVWMAMLASQVVYVAVLRSGVVTTPETPSLPAFFPMVLGVAAVGTAVAAHFFWRRASGAGQPTHLASPHPTAAFPFYLVAWALDESIAIYGLVLGFLGFPVTVWAPFSAAALLLFLVHRSRADT